MSRLRIVRGDENEGLAQPSKRKAKQGEFSIWLVEGGQIFERLCDRETDRYYWSKRGRRWDKRGSRYSQVFRSRAEAVAHRRSVLLEEVDEA